MAKKNEHQHHDVRANAGHISVDAERAKDLEKGTAARDQELQKQTADREDRDTSGSDRH